MIARWARKGTLQRPLRIVTPDAIETMLTYQSCFEFRRTHSFHRSNGEIVQSVYREDTQCNQHILSNGQGGQEPFTQPTYSKRLIISEHASGRAFKVYEVFWKPLHFFLGPTRLLNSFEKERIEIKILCKCSCYRSSIKQAEAGIYRAHKDGETISIESLVDNSSVSVSPVPLKNPCAGLYFLLLEVNLHSKHGVDFSVSLKTVLEPLKWLFEVFFGEPEFVLIARGAPYLSEEDCWYISSTILKPSETGYALVQNEILRRGLQESGQPAMESQRE